MIHEIKCEPKYFAAIKNGSKTFEVRKNDRPYKVGDILAINEFIPESVDPYDDMFSMPSVDERFVSGGRYTGKSVLALITYILNDDEYVKKGFVILGIKNCLVYDGENTILS